MSQKCAPSGSRQRVVSEAKSSQHDITKGHIKVFKYEQQVVKYDPQLPFSVALPIRMHGKQIELQTSKIKILAKAVYHTLRVEK